MNNSHSEFVMVEREREVSPEPMDGWTEVQFTPEVSNEATTTAVEEEVRVGPLEPATLPKQEVESLTQPTLRDPPDTDREPSAAQQQQPTSSELQESRRAAEALLLEEERARASEYRARQEAERLELESLRVRREAERQAELDALRRRQEEELLHQAMKESEEMELLRRLQEELDAVSAARLMDTSPHTTTQQSQSESSCQFEEDDEEERQLTAAERQMRDLEKYRRMQQELDEMSRQRLRETSEAEDNTSSMMENLRRLQRELDEMSAQRLREEDEQTAASPPPPPYDPAPSASSVESIAATPTPRSCMCLGASKGFHRRDCPLSTS